MTLSGTLAWNIRVCMRSDQQGREDEPPLPSTAWLAWHLLSPQQGHPGGTCQPFLDQPGRV